MRPHLLTKMLVFRDCSSKAQLESHAYNAGLAFSSAVMLSFRNGYMVMVPTSLVCEGGDANHGPAAAPSRGARLDRGI